MDKGALQNGDEPLKEGVKDILIKHHLFSWDLWPNCLIRDFTGIILRYF